MKFAGKLVQGLPKKIAFAATQTTFGGEHKPSDEVARFFQKIIRKEGDDMADRARVYAPLRERFIESFKGGSFADAYAQFQKMFGEITSQNPSFTATVPIVLDNCGGRELGMIGSGVLLRICNRAFLLTAAHVADVKMTDHS